MAQLQAELPDSISIAQYEVRADSVRIRIGLLVSNGLTGLLLVAESVAVHQVGASDSYEAAIEGANKVLKPVLTATLTTIAAFAPIFSLTESFGSYVKALPLFVCAALIASLVECFLLLPGHMRGRAQLGLAAGQGATADAVQHYWRALRQAESELGYAHGSLVKATFAQSGQHFRRRDEQPSENQAGIFVELHDGQGGRTPTKAFMKRWRSTAGDYVGLQSADIQGFRAGPDGSDIHVVANGPDLAGIQTAIDQAEQALRSIDGLSNVRNSIESSVREIRFTLSDAGADMGLSAMDIGRQVQAATSGIVVDTVIDDLSAIDVIVRFTGTINQENSILQLPIVTADARSVASYEVASATSVSAQGRLFRDSGLLSANLQADVDYQLTNNVAVWA